jgi:hypothetical protein
MLNFFPNWYNFIVVYIYEGITITKVKLLLHED